MLRRLIDRLFGRQETPAPADRIEPPALRCKPGQMAWIKGVPDGLTGVSQLNNRAVKTLQITEGGKWAIEPHQYFIASRAFIWDGVLYAQGEAVGVCAVADECLEPWKEDGVSLEEVRELFAPEAGQRIPVYTYDNLPRQGQQ